MENTVVGLNPKFLTLFIIAFMSQFKISKILV